MVVRRRDAMLAGSRSRGRNQPAVPQGGFGASGTVDIDHRPGRLQRLQGSYDAPTILASARALEQIFLADPFGGVCGENIPAENFPELGRRAFSGSAVEM